MIDWIQKYSLSLGVQHSEWQNNMKHRVLQTKIILKSYAYKSILLQCHVPLYIGDT